MMKVFFLEGEALLDYGPLLPATVMEDDVEYGGMVYVGCEVDEAPAGVAVLVPGVSSVVLRYLFLLPAYRGCGLGRRFVNELFLLFYDDMEEMTADVTPELQPEAAAVLSACGFDSAPNGRASYRFQLAELDSPAMRREDCTEVVPLNLVPSVQIQKLWEYMAYNGRDLVPSPLESRFYHPRLSCAVMMDNVISAILLVSAQENKVHVEYLFSMALSPKALKKLFSYLYQKGSELFSDGVEVSFEIIEPRLVKVLSDLIDLKPVQQFHYSFPLQRFRERLAFAYGWMQDFEAQVLFSVI